jgi:hypothetical protein
MDVKKITPKDSGSTLNTRKTVRRKNADRRSEVRFEPEKENRRKNKGRRSSDKDIWDFGRPDQELPN